MLKIYLTVFIFLFSVLSPNLVYSSTELNDDNIEGTTDDDDQTVECGSIIREDVKLTSDLDCVNIDGLVVGKSDITIDLNNHSISGTGIDASKVGIVILGGVGWVDSDTGSLENVRILGPGKISDFQSGIMVVDSKNIGISDILIQRSETGLFEKNSRNITVKDSSFNRNSIGLALDSSFTNEIINNMFNSNQLTGIGIVGSFDNKIVSNKIDDSVNGIYLHENSEDNRIESNVVFNSHGADLNNGNGMPISEANNVFLNNSCSFSLPDGLCENLN